MSDDIPEELQDLPELDSHSDIVVDDETERKHFEHNGKRAWVDVKTDLRGQRVMELRSQNTTIRRGEEQLNIAGLIDDMMRELIVDISVDESVDLALKTADSEFYNKLNQAVEEVSGGLEGVDIDEGK